MDRFEAISSSGNFIIISIYIPVWIDLKLFLCEKQNVQYIIYIPVWIDLKLVMSDYFERLDNLHSSMDRFEAHSRLYL